MEGMRLEQAIIKINIYKHIIINNNNLSPRYLLRDMPGFLFSFGGVFYDQ